MYMCVLHTKIVYLSIAINNDFLSRTFSSALKMVLSKNYYSNMTARQRLVRTLYRGGGRTILTVTRGGS